MPTDLGNKNKAIIISNSTKWKFNVNLLSHFLYFIFMKKKWKTMHVCIYNESYLAFQLFFFIFYYIYFFFLWPIGNVHWIEHIWSTASVGVISWCTILVPGWMLQLWKKQTYWTNILLYSMWVAWLFMCNVHFNERFCQGK